MEQAPFPNCIYKKTGCKEPKDCGRCGFDRLEAERRKLLPLVPDHRGLRRKIIKRHESEET